MDLYAQNIMDHYKHPRNKGELLDANFARAESNPTCGDSAKFYIKIKNDKLEDFKFNGAGCAISQASISIIGEALKGKKIKNILIMNKKNIKKYLGIDLTERRLKCAMLGLLGIQNAILAYQKKPLKVWGDN